MCPRGSGAENHVYRVVLIGGVTCPGARGHGAPHLLLLGDVGGVVTHLVDDVGALRGRHAQEVRACGVSPLVAAGPRLPSCVQRRGEKRPIRAITLLRNHCDRCGYASSVTMCASVSASAATLGYVGMSAAEQGHERAIAVLRRGTTARLRTSPPNAASGLGSAVLPVASRRRRRPFLPTSEQPPRPSHLRP